MSKSFQKSGNFARSRETQTKISELRERHGINFAVMPFNLMQIPVLIAWFLSLRYVLTLPEIYPQILDRNSIDLII